MSLSRIRQWIRKEERYLWILIGIVLFHSVFSILGVLTTPVVKSEMPSREEPVSSNGNTFKKAVSENESLQLYIVFITFLILFVLLLGLLLTIQFLRKKLQGEFMIPWRRADQRILWTIQDVFHIVVLIILCGYLIEFFQAIFFHIVPWKVSESVRLLLTTFLMDIVAFYLIVRLVKMKKGQSLSHLGLSKEAFTQNLLFGLKGYTALLPSLVILLFISLWLADIFRLVPPQQPLYDLFKEETSQSILITAVFLVIFLGPIIEEILFRGFFYNALKAKWGKGWAIFSSGFLFAALHANLIGFLPITFLGCALAYGYEVTGSLVASITIHVVHNSLVMVLFFLTDRFSQFFGGGLS